VAQFRGSCFVASIGKGADSVTPVVLVLIGMTATGSLDNGEGEVLGMLLLRPSGGVEKETPTI